MSDMSHRFSGQNSDQLVELPTDSVIDPAKSIGMTGIGQFVNQQIYWFYL